jgi:hypothetical protein
MNFYLFSSVVSQDLSHQIEIANATYQEANEAVEHTFHDDVKQLFPRKIKTILWQSFH